MYCGEYINGLWISVDILKHRFREQEIRKPMKACPCCSAIRKRQGVLCSSVLYPHTCCGKASGLLEAE